MKKATKGILIACGVMAALGLTFVGVGTVMGAKSDDVMKLAHIGYRDVKEELTDDLDLMDETYVNTVRNTSAAIVHHYDDHDDDDHDDDWDDRYDHDDDRDYDRDQSRSSVNNNSANNNSSASNSPADNSSAGSISAESVFDRTFTDPVSKLDILLAAGELEMVPGTTNGSVRVVADGDLMLDSWVERNELHVETYAGAGQSGLSTETSHVIIYYPEDLNEIDVEMGAGKLKSELLQAGEISLEIGAGGCEVTSLKAVREAELGVGTGYIMVGSLESENISAECGAGEMSLTVNDAYSSYNYELEAAAGEIILGDTAYNGPFSEKNIINGRTAKEMDLSCGMGSLVVHFLK